MKTFPVVACGALAMVAASVQCFSPAAITNNHQHRAPSSTTTTALLVSSVHQSSPDDRDDDDDDDDVAPKLSSSSSSPATRRGVLARTLVSAASLLAVGTTTTAVVAPAQARLDPVDKPQLLPADPGRNVIQTEKFLTAGEERRMDAKLAKLERDTGYRVRVLCQNYPLTPGLAVRDYWSVGQDGQKDDRYVVLVVDQFGGRGNVLNFNVGDGLRLAFPNTFWTRLQNKYGTTFFVRDNGVDTAVISAVDEIVQGLYDAARELS